MATHDMWVEDGGSTRNLAVAGIAGATAGIVFGLMIQFVLERMTIIGALYTLGNPSLSVGWLAHMSHSVLFAVVYAITTDRPQLRSYAERPTTGAVVGAGFAALLWFVNIVFVWPLWLNAVGLPNAPSFPYFASVRPLVGHLVWGTLLGVAYPLFERATPGTG